MAQNKDNKLNAQSNDRGKKSGKGLIASGACIDYVQRPYTFRLRACNFTVGNL